jgi:hypothetical protein
VEEPDSNTDSNKNADSDQGIDSDFISDGEDDSFSPLSAAIPILSGANLFIMTWETTSANEQITIPTA